MDSSKADMVTRADVDIRKWMTVLLFFTISFNDTFITAITAPVLPWQMADIGEHPSRLFSSHFIDHLPQSARREDRNGGLMKNYAIQISSILSAKQVIEMLSTVALGFLLIRLGSAMYKKLIFAGTVVTILGTILFAYSRNFILLLAARVPQALGTAITSVCGMTLLSTAITNQREQTILLGRAMSGYAAGEAVGYVVGGTLAEYAGLQWPFFTAVLLNLVIFIELMLAKDPETESTDQSSIKCGVALLKDPEILTGLGICLVCSFDMALLYSVIPLWMAFKIGASQSTIGLVLCIGMVIHAVAQFLSAGMARRLGYWQCILSGFILTALGFCAYAFCGSVWVALVPLAIDRIGSGIIEGCNNPVLNHLAHKMDPSLVGPVSGLYHAAVGVGMIAGSMIGGCLLKVLTYNQFFWAVSAFILCLSPMAAGWRRVRLNNYLEDATD